MNRVRANKGQKPEANTRSR